MHRLVSIIIGFTPHRLLAVTNQNGLKMLLLTNILGIFLPMNTDSYEADILGQKNSGIRVYITEVCNRIFGYRETKFEILRYKIALNFI